MGTALLLQDFSQTVFCKKLQITVCTKYFVFYEKLQTTVIRILADHIWFKNMEKGFQLSEKNFANHVVLKKSQTTVFQNFRRPYWVKKYGNSDFTLGSIDPPSSLLNRSHFHF